MFDTSNGRCESNTTTLVLSENLLSSWMIHGKSCPPPQLRKITSYGKFMSSSRSCTNSGSTRSHDVTGSTFVLMLRLWQITSRIFNAQMASMSLADTKITTSPSYPFLSRISTSCCEYVSTSCSSVPEKSKRTILHPGID